MGTGIGVGAAAGCFIIGAAWKLDKDQPRGWGWFRAIRRDGRPARGALPSLGTAGGNHRPSGPGVVEFGRGPSAREVGAVHGGGHGLVGGLTREVERGLGLGQLGTQVGRGAGREVGV